MKRDPISGLTATLALCLLAATPLPASGETVEKPAGVLETTAGSYGFTPQTCAIYQDEGAYDIEMGGPGTAPDGEVFYFEFSSTANALSVDLGVDSRFASAERVLQAGRHVSEEFTVQVEGEVLSIAGLVLVDENGQLIDEAASLRVDCGT